MSTNAASPNKSGEQDESIDSEWEAVARKALWELLFRHREELEESLGTIESRVMGNCEDDLDAEDIREFRRNLYDVQRLVEEDIVPLVDGVEEYEMATINLTHRRLADSLDVDLHDLRDLPRASEADLEETDADH